MVDDTGLEPVTSRTSTQKDIFYNIFWLFLLVFAPKRLVSDTLRYRCFRVFHVCLWLVVWSDYNTTQRPFLVEPS